MADCSLRSSTTALASTSNRPEAGHGLANVSERVAAHGGNLVVESTPGRGTTVHANIPVADAASQRDDPTAHSGSEDHSVFSSVPPPATQRSGYEG